MMEELEKYNYKFPPELIAQKPAKPRESARLLVHKKRTGEIIFDNFKNITKYIPENSILVFNQTKVIPARIVLRKETGGLVRVLYLEKEGNKLRVLSDRKLKIGSRLWLNTKIYFEVEENSGKDYLLEPSFPVSKILSVLKRYGEAPLPPYIKHSPLSSREKRDQYQTVFAKRTGSIAAPTASLHFSKKLMLDLRKAGLEVRFVTLHVGLGTFAPVTEENLSRKKLHREFFVIDKKTADFLNEAKKNGKKIIAVGTTVVRTLESAARNGRLEELSGETSLFIQEKYKFKFVDGVITNFHVPRSSLLMLVSALIGRDKLLELYDKAIEKNFRLFSFGDGMMITE